MSYNYDNARIGHSGSCYASYESFAEAINGIDHEHKNGVDTCDRNSSNEPAEVPPIDENGFDSSDEESLSISQDDSNNCCTIL